jgi:hypothetical protein
VTEKELTMFSLVRNDSNFHNYASVMISALCNLLINVIDKVNTWNSAMFI